jgi:ABC-type multidrug transport system fused ATPase/permease subunit
LSLRFEAVTFAHEPSRRVLDDLDVTIPAGRVVAMVGATGSGKSTFMALIDRLLVPDAGRISVGGVDLSTVAEPDLRRSVALVFQEPFLFAGSVLENIDLEGDLDPDAVSRATAIAQVDEFVDDLPHGWATIIGERGVTLSGGQRQRVALARALARQPQLLLLDDATSSVDPATEARILTGLARVLSGTVITVASRPSTIALADDVLFLEEGRVAGFGAHRELFASQPGYRRLVESYERERAAR